MFGILAGVAGGGGHTLASVFFVSGLFADVCYELIITSSRPIGRVGVYMICLRSSEASFSDTRGNPCPH